MRTLETVCQLRVLLLPSLEETDSISVNILNEVINKIVEKKK